ncbi:hypothetical protein GDO81_005855 [Engystomops pustulosus]|uniref:Uncharacterized protein n=1 Tax=Engystomops pustulosus TaxID=76066 RepID=A0AAV7CTK4_ENGPU|nr:hypothetical protein GDO81_005855 [Engystomops pustulosus]
MGSTESKSQSAETAVSKTAEQENGHVKANGDPAPKTNGEPAAANGSAEPVTEEAGSGETIEQAPPANGETKPEEPPGKQAKKKRFSFKKNFKLPFRKTKKDAAAAEAPPAGDEDTAPKQEEEAAKPAESTPENADASSPAENPNPEAAAPAEEAAVQPEEPVTAPEQTPQSDESVPSTETPAEPQKEE